MKPLQPIETDTLIDNLALRDVPYFAGPVSMERTSFYAFYDDISSGTSQDRPLNLDIKK